MIVGGACLLGVPYFTPGGTALLYGNSVKKNFDLYCKLMATSLQPTPELALLSIIPGPLKSVKKDVLRHFLAAARTVITQRWKSTGMPSLGDWTIEVDCIRDLENLLVQ